LSSFWSSFSSNGLPIAGTIFLSLELEAFVFESAGFACGPGALLPWRLDGALVQRLFDEPVTIYPTIDVLPVSPRASPYPGGSKFRSRFSRRRAAHGPFGFVFGEWLSRALSCLSEAIVMLIAAGSRTRP
jgi:hypothetical protein